MDEGTKRFHENRKTGNITEDIFEYLIKSMDGWDVIPYGIENHITQLKNSLKDNHSKNAEKIKYMPDFVVLNKKNDNIMLVEVKYMSFVDRREKNKLLFGFQKNLIEKYLKFWRSAMLCIAHQEKPYFYVIDLKDINEKQKERSNVFLSPADEGMNKHPMDFWNFIDIQKNIKDIFPDLTDEAIEIAGKDIIKCKFKK